MTAGEAKTWLSRARNLNKEIQALRTARIELLTSLSGSAVKLNDINIQHQPSNGTEKALAKYADYGSKLDLYVDTLVEIKTEILEIIRQVPSSTLRTVLIHRYINTMSWEDIADIMDVSREHLIRAWHEEALREVADFLA